MTNLTIVGETETLVFTLYDEAGALADPTELTLEIKDPSGNTETLTYTGADITRESIGVFSYDLPYDEAGVWLWEIETSGAIKPIVKHGSITVHPQYIESE
jgi:YD repeat-containing protein